MTLRGSRRARMQLGRFGNLGRRRRERPELSKQLGLGHSNSQARARFDSLGGEQGGKLGCGLPETSRTEGGIRGLPVRYDRLMEEGKRSEEAAEDRAVFVGDRARGSSGCSRVARTTSGCARSEGCRPTSLDSAFGALARRLAIPTGMPR